MIPRLRGWQNHFPENKGFNAMTMRGLELGNEYSLIGGDLVVEN